MRRMPGWGDLSDDEWKRAVEWTLDRQDEETAELRETIHEENAELRERLQWMQRTAIGLLISVLLLLAGFVGTVAGR